MRWILAAAALLFFPASSLAQGTATETVDFTISVEPVFVMNSSSEEGGNIRLGPVGPGESPASGMAAVSVRSNTGRLYRIVQRLEQNLLNERGSDFTEDPVLFTVTDGANGGHSEVKSPAVLTTQPVVLFASGPEGESDDFRIAYSVSSKKLVPAGTYRARVLIEEEFQ